MRGTNIQILGAPSLSRRTLKPSPLPPLSYLFPHTRTPLSVGRQTYMSPPRILLCGDVLGRLPQLFKRVSSVNKSSGPFDALFCVGQFFPENNNDEKLSEEFMNYIEGRSQIPLPTYFIGDYGVGAAKILSPHLRTGTPSFKTDGFQICPNLYWLKGSGKFTLLGLSITYLSGKRSEGTQLVGAYTEDDIDALRAWAEEPGIVDLFLTNEWPSEVANGADTSETPPGLSDSRCTDPVISEVVAEIKPRYHVAGSKGVYYAREPYSNNKASHVTRFFGLAPVGNKDKQKFIHAISPTPASTMSVEEICMKPSNTTSSPYEFGVVKAEAKAAKRPSNDVSDTQYWRYDVAQKRQKQGDGIIGKPCFKFITSGSCSRGEKCNFDHNLDAREQFMNGVCLDFICKGKCEKGPDCSFKHHLVDKNKGNIQSGQTGKTGRSKECWFCLSSAKVESHLILSVGENYYCALAKGPLVEDHALIVPVEHSPNTLLVAPEEELELERFKKALKMFFKKQGNEVIFFEWVHKHSTHANIQAIPIPSNKSSFVQQIFNLAAEKLGFKFQASNSNNDTLEGRNLLKTLYNKDLSFFYVELPEGTILSHSVGDNEKFPSQFGREVVAGLLKLPDRADWRNCMLSKEEETRMTNSFKQRFSEFDPTS